MTFTQSIDRDRLGVLSGAILLGLALARLLETPTRPLTTSVLGSPLGINLSSTTLMLLVMAGLAITATESLVRSHPISRQGYLERSAIFWIVPTLLTISLAGWLEAADLLGHWIAGLIVSALLIPLSLVIEYSSVNPEQRGEITIRWTETVLIHMVALMIFALIFDQRTRALLSGTATFMGATFLAIRFFWFSADAAKTAWMYGFTAGLLVGLLSWALNYWPMSTLQGSLVLFLFFYAIVGLIQQFLEGRFGRRVVLEYGGVAALGTVLIVILL